MSSLSWSSMCSSRRRSQILGLSSFKRLNNDRSYCQIPLLYKLRVYIKDHHGFVSVILQLTGPVFFILHRTIVCLIKSGENNKHSTLKGWQYGPPPVSNMSQFIAKLTIQRLNQKSQDSLTLLLSQLYSLQSISRR